MIYSRNFLSTQALAIVSNRSSFSRAGALMVSLPPSPSRTRVLVVSTPSSRICTLATSSSQCIITDDSIGGGGKRNASGSGSDPNDDSNNNNSCKNKKKKKAMRWLRILNYFAWIFIKRISYAWHSKKPIWRLLRATALIGLFMCICIMPSFFPDEKRDEMAKRVKPYLDIWKAGNDLNKTLSGM